MNVVNLRTAAKVGYRQASLPSSNHHVWSNHEFNAGKVLDRKVVGEPNEGYNPTNAETQ